MEKPILPQDPKKIEKIRNLIFIVTIGIMLALSIFFFWKAFSIKSGEKVEEPSSTPPTEETTPTQQPEVSTYTVQEGDTLWSIAQKFGISVDDLLKANDLTDPDSLQVGQELIIPQGEISPQGMIP